MSTLNSTEVRKSAEIFRYRLQQTIYDSSLRMFDIPNEIGMTRGTVFKYLSGTRVPDFSHLIAIAVYFKVSLDWLTIAGMYPLGYLFLDPTILFAIVR